MYLISVTYILILIFFRIAFFPEISILEYIYKLDKKRKKTWCANFLLFSFVKYLSQDIYIYIYSTKREANFLPYRKVSWDIYSAEKKRGKSGIAGYIRIMVFLWQKRVEEKGKGGWLTIARRKIAMRFLKIYRGGGLYYSFLRINLFGLDSSLSVKYRG